MYSEVLEKIVAPLVIKRIKSKKFTDHIVIKIKFISINGLSSGRVMWRKLLLFVAPSTKAASYTMGLIENNPAVKNSIVNGVPCHIFAITIVHTTILGSDNHEIGFNPICSKP